MRLFLGFILGVRPLALAAVLGLLAGCSTTSTDALQVAAPPPLPTEKYATIVVDASSGRTLHQVAASEYRYPASLTKMMTLYMLFEALDSGRVSRASQIPVSQNCARQPPSKLGLKAGTTIDVGSAIGALSVKSANDVACAVGEYLGGGSESRFASMMTAKARSVGMGRTVFRNASGLPDDGQVTTARDMAVLGMALKKRFPHHFANFSARSFAYHGRTINGHNRLIGRVDGVDGIKTGYIRASGFNIVTSVGRGGKRLVVVVMGGKTARERDAHVEELIERYLPASGRLRPAPAVAAAPAAPPVEPTPVEAPAAVPAVDQPSLPGVAPAAEEVPVAAAPAPDMVWVEGPDAAMPEGAE